MIVSKIIERSIKTGKLSHAYLLAGRSKSDIQNSAHEVSKVILCETNNNCGVCNNCLRIDSNIYTDIINVNGFEGVIKKTDIQDIISDFTLSASEVAGIKIYIINGCENMGLVAANSLLKFIEEPPEDTIAILTSTNVDKIIPTIISRVQIITIEESNKSILVDELLSKGFSNDQAQIMLRLDIDATDEMDDFKDIVGIARNNNVIKFISKYSKDKKSAMIFLGSLLYFSKLKGDTERIEEILVAMTMLERNVSTFPILARL